MTPSISPGPAPAAASSRPSAVLRVFDDRPFQADDEFLALAFAADGTLLSVEGPGLLRRWDLAGQRQLEWHALSDLENLWLFSGNGRALASASDDVSLWDTATGQLQAVLPQASWVTALGLTTDAGRVAAGLDDGTITLWDVARDDLLHELRGHAGPVSALAFRADGQQLASAGEDRIIRLWDVGTGECLGALDGPHDRIPALAWHPQGHRLYSSGWDTSVWVWDVAAREPLILLNTHEGQILAMALSADGQRLACADSGRAIHLWDLTNHRAIQVFRGYEGEVRALAFRPDGQVLVSGGSDRVLHIWGSSARDVAEASPTPPAEVRAGLALSPAGDRLVSIRPGRGVRIWDTANGAKLLDLETGGEPLAVALRSDGSTLAVGGGDRRLSLWDAMSGERRAVLEGPTLPVTALAFAPQAPVLASASGSGCDVWLWHAERGEAMLMIPDAVDGCSIEAIAFAPQGDVLAVAGVDWLSTGGSDGGVCLWDVATPRRLVRLPGGARALAFHPAGRLLVTASLKRTVQVWDTTTGEQVAELTGHDDTVTCVACSPDGRFIASGGDDRTVRLWDVSTGAALGTTELDTQVKFVCFAPDGRSLYTGNGNTSCYQVRLARK